MALETQRTTRTSGASVTRSLRRTVAGCLFAASFLAPVDQAQADLVQIDERLAEAVRSGTSARDAFQESLTRLGPDGADQFEQGLSLRRTLVIALDRLAKANPSSDPFGYWQQADRLLETLQASAKFEAVEGIDNATEQLTDRVWAVYIDGLLAEVPYHPITSPDLPDDAIMLGQWIQAAAGPAILAVELYAVQATQTLEWGQKDFDGLLAADPSGLESRDDVLLRRAFDRERLTAFADLGTLERTAAGRVKNVVSTATGRFLSIILAGAKLPDGCTDMGGLSPEPGGSLPEAAAAVADETEQGAGDAAPEAGAAPPDGSPPAAEAAPLVVTESGEHETGATDQKPTEGPAKEPAEEPLGEEPSAAASSSAGAEPVARLQVDCVPPSLPESLAGRIVVFDPLRELVVVDHPIEQLLIDPVGFFALYDSLASRWP